MIDDIPPSSRKLRIFAILLFIGAVLLVPASLLSGMYGVSLPLDVLQYFLDNEMVVFTIAGVISLGFFARRVLGEVH